MKNVIGSLVAIAGLAAAANAQSLLNLQVSTDGLNWSDNVEVVAAPGTNTTVLMRASISYTGSTPAFGFASLTWQPVFSNVRAADVVDPFATQGNNLNGGGVILDASPLDGPFGRIQPFASTGPSGTQAYAVHRHTAMSGGAPDGNFLRIARNDITRWMGTGPTTTASAVNNFNGAGGVACVQKATPGTADPARNDSISNVVIFQIALTLDGVPDGDTHIIGVEAPTAGMSRNSNNGNREASWFGPAGDNSGSVKGIVEVDGATITITPAPGALALLGLGGLIVGRRRR